MIKASSNLACVRSLGLMLRLKLSPKALQDVENIYEYTFVSWGIKQAEKYVDELNDAMIALCKKTELGSLYYFKSGNFRKMNVNRHILFYRRTEKELIVVRILHERMDLTMHL